MSRQGILFFRATLPETMFLLMITVWSHGQVATSNSSASTQDTIISKIFTDYKRHERPTELSGTPTDVVVYIHILSINKVDVRNMEFTMDMLLRQLWNDSRLAWTKINSYNRTIVSPSLKDKLWIPDLFFRNGKTGYVHSMTTPNFLMRLSHWGEVLYSQKVTMSYSCQMDLGTFPMDSQTCGLNIGSYGYTMDQLKFHWRQEQPIVLEKNLQISEFDKPHKVNTFDCSEGSKTATGRYTCLEANFTLERQLGSYLSTTYIPNILIVMVSWLNFWVSVDAVPARVTLGLLSLLGILTQASSISSTLPRVSYIKAIDIWTNACLIFVIGALIEFGIATTLARKVKQDEWKNEIKSVVRQELSRWCSACQQSQLSLTSKNYNNNRGQLEFCEELESLLTQHAAADKVAKAKQPKTTPSDVDGYSRFLFPACFLLYNFFYWLYYLHLVKEIKRK